MSASLSFRTSLRSFALAPVAALALVACGDYDSRVVTATQDPTVARVPPSIEVEPQPIAVSEGEPALFFVQVTSRAPVTYQWHRDGVAIAGATRPVHQVHAATLGDDQAQYSVVVGNDSGRTASRAAVLIVTPRNEALAWK